MKINIHGNIKQLQVNEGDGVQNMYTHSPELTQAMADLRLALERSLPHCLPEADRAEISNYITELSEATPPSRLQTIFMRIKEMAEVFNGAETIHKAAVAALAALPMTSKLTNFIS